MTACYLDSSAAVKLYVRETGPDWLATLVDRRARHSLFLARVSLVEHAAAPFRRVRGGTELGADDASADGRAIRLMIATGSMLPEHYLGEGGNANRATAAEMGLPAMKRFQRRQEVFRAMVTRIINRVLDEGMKVGRLGPRANRKFVVQFEELSAAPIEGLAAATERLTRALKMAEEQGWVSKEEAGRMWRRYAGQVDESAEQGGEEPGR